MLEHRIERIRRRILTARARSPSFGLGREVEIGPIMKTVSRSAGRANCILFMSDANGGGQAFACKGAAAFAQSASETTAVTPGVA